MLDSALLDACGTICSGARTTSTSGDPERISSSVGAAASKTEFVGAGLRVARVVESYF